MTLPNASPYLPTIYDGARRRREAAGIEPVSGSALSANDLGKLGSPFGTFSGTVGDETGEFDPDLLAVVEAWPSLPAEARQQIQNIVDSHVSNSEGGADVDATG